MIWGVCVRVTVGVSMHWFVGYICHTHGPQNWLIDNGAVQAHNVPWAAILSFGESWHNNHHAFPASARHGLYPGQLDLGFNFLKWLERHGLAWDIQTPETLPMRRGISRVSEGQVGSWSLSAGQRSIGTCGSSRRCDADSFVVEKRRDCARRHPMRARTCCCAVHPQSAQRYARASKLRCAYVVRAQSSERRRMCERSAKSLLIARSWSSARVR